MLGSLDKPTSVFLACRHEPLNQLNKPESCKLLSIVFSCSSSVTGNAVNLLITILICSHSILVTSG
ncbi:hypothetical protein ELK10_31815 [Klebsiella pneumoniae]|nr:hypothetical protein [Klebsiella pneumoniae]